jgi:phage shock protein PspC (stress-responsive transcriptional regulator)
VTSNHATFRRHENALLAGVCADLAQRLGWNVWALRALAIIGLFVHAIGTGALYVLMALLLPWLRGDEAAEPDLSAPELSGRKQRIADLERRFRDLEQETDRD